MHSGRNIIIDLWYSDTLTDCDGLTYSFSDIDCVYRGNIVKNCMPFHAGRVCRFTKLFEWRNAT